MSFPIAEAKLIKPPLPKTQWNIVSDRTSSTLQTVTKAESYQVREIDRNKTQLKLLIFNAYLEGVRDNVLKSLKLGTQAPAYKTAKKVLDQFIEHLETDS